LVQTTGILGPERDESALAEGVARQWLDRYGVVAREWWRRERPTVSWRAVYRELKRLEFRGEVRRGYFVNGLTGAQFALPQAVELLRASGPAASVTAESTSSADDGFHTTRVAQPVIVMLASDPANAYALPPSPLADAAEKDSDVQLMRRRGRGALIATRAGVVLLVAEGRGRRVTVRADADPSDVVDAARALARHLAERPDRKRDVVIETIDGANAGHSAHSAAFESAGFRSTGSGLRFYAPPR
jgi:ATP-dependent Lhr-like helicase